MKYTKKKIGKGLRNPSRKWYFRATHNRIEEMKETAKTIKRRWSAVLGRIAEFTMGILEGPNSVVRAVKAKGRGHRTFKSLTQID
jgi:transposase